MPDSFFLMSQGKNVSFSLHRVSGFLHRVSAFYTDYAADYDTDNRAHRFGAHHSSLQNFQTSHIRDRNLLIGLGLYALFSCAVHVHAAVNPLISPSKAILNENPLLSLSGFSGGKTSRGTDSGVNESSAPTPCLILDQKSLMIWQESEPFPCYCESSNLEIKSPILHAA